MQVKYEQTPVYLRESQIIPDIVRIGHSTLWRWVQQGKFPKPVRLGQRVTAWRAIDLASWMDQRDLARDEVVH
jgi:predicted DNA-binding transcriptional regulator AlpA